MEKLFVTLKVKFEQVDQQGLGFISRDQMDSVLFLSGITMKDEEHKLLLENVDLDGKDHITFDRLKGCLRTMISIGAEENKNKRRKFIKACKRFDKKNSGSLSEIDLVSAFLYSGVEKNEFILEEAVEDAKENTNGLVPYRVIIDKMLIADGSLGTLLEK